MSMSKTSKLYNFINYRVRLTLIDGRTLVGKFMAFDKHMNIVLGDAEEFRTIITKGKAGNEEKEQKRTLGLLLLRGESIVSMIVEGPPPAEDSRVNAIKRQQQMQQQQQQKQAAAAAAAMSQPAARGVPMMPGMMPAPGMIPPPTMPIPVVPPAQQMPGMMPFARGTPILGSTAAYPYPLPNMGRGQFPGRGAPPQQ
jgi:small nuclear ribonucleoprotein B and B'